jgi:hypothetical protein
MYIGIFRYKNSGPCYLYEILHRIPIFNQKLNGQSFRSKKRPLGGHILGQRWPKSGNRCKAPGWKAYDSSNAPTPKFLILTTPGGSNYVNKFMKLDISITGRNLTHKMSPRYLVQIHWNKYMRANACSHAFVTVHIYANRFACICYGSHVFVPRMYLYLYRNMHMDM